MPFGAVTSLLGLAPDRRRLRPLAPFLVDRLVAPTIAAAAATALFDAPGARAVKLLQTPSYEQLLTNHHNEFDGFVLLITT